MFTPCEPSQAKRPVADISRRADPARDSETATALNTVWQSLVLQPKLTISQADDPSEREADQVAERVLRMPLPAIQRTCTACTTSGPPCPKCEEQTRAQRKAAGTAEPMAAPDSFVGQLGTGSPLEPGVRAFFEPRLGRNLGNVRIHTNTGSADAAKRLNAHAFALGQHIAFAPGQYAPDSGPGQRLLAHELAHVAQEPKGPPLIQAQREEGGLQSVMVFGGVPGFLDCTTENLDADPDTSCCSSTTLSLIPGLYDTSREYTDRALSRMRDGANVDGAIRQHFGGDALWHRDEILRRLQLIRNELDEQSTHIVLCRIALSARNAIGVDLLSRVDGRLFCPFNVLARGRVGGNVATLCVDADGTAAGGWPTLLHEMVHLSGVGNLPNREVATPAQVAAGEYETYEGGQGYPNPMPYSLRNADSYSSFVSDVGASGWSEESNPVAALPTIEAGPALTLEEAPRPGLEAGILWTPFGSNIQMIVGARALWLPHREEEEPIIEPTNLRAYAGPELGLRWIVGGNNVQFVLDVAGGGGAYVTVDEQVDWALAARLGLGVRFGGPQAGFGISTDFMRLFHFSKDDLVGNEAEDWLGGLVIRGHWGGSSSRPR